MSAILGALKIPVVFNIFPYVLFIFLRFFPIFIEYCCVDGFVILYDFLSYSWYFFPICLFFYNVFFVFYSFNVFVNILFSILLSVMFFVVGYGIILASLNFSIYLDVSI